MAVAAVALWWWSTSDRWVGSAAGASFRIVATNLAIPVALGIVVWLVCQFVLRRRQRTAPHEPLLHLVRLAVAPVEHLGVGHVFSP